LTDHVIFLDRFLTVEELAVLLAGTDLYLTPYRSREQIVSGALTFAVAAGCAVVSTPYFYAEDLLRSGAGVLVPFGDSPALAASVNDLLGSPARLAAARAEARQIGTGLGWFSVGQATAQVLAWLPLLGLVLGVALGANPVAVVLGGGVGTLAAGVGLVLVLLGRGWTRALLARAERDDDPSRRTRVYWPVRITTISPRRTAELGP